MKYEYTITDKKHGQNQMRAGLIISVSTISLYLLLSFFHPNFHFDSLLIIVIVMLFTLFGIVIYREGEERRNRDQGLWSFLVNQNGVYLSAPDNLTRHVTLDKIIVIEKVDLDEDGYMYILAHQDNINFNLGLSTNINLDFDKIIDVLL